MYYKLTARILRVKGVGKKRPSRISIIFQAPAYGNQLKLIENWMQQNVISDDFLAYENLQVKPYRMPDIIDLDP